MLTAVVYTCFELTVDSALTFILPEYISILGPVQQEVALTI